MSNQVTAYKKSPALQSRLHNSDFPVHISALTGTKLEKQEIRWPFLLEEGFWPLTNSGGKGSSTEDRAEKGKSTPIKSYVKESKHVHNLLDVSVSSEL